MPSSPLRKIRTAGNSRSRRSSLAIHGQQIPLRPKDSEPQHHGEQGAPFWPQMDAQQMLAAYINQRMEAQSPTYASNGQVYSPMAGGNMDWGGMAMTAVDASSPGRLQELNALLPQPAFAHQRPDEYDATTPASLANSPTSYTRNPFSSFWGHGGGGLVHAGSGAYYYPAQTLAAQGSGIPDGHAGSASGASSPTHHALDGTRNSPNPAWSQLQNAASGIPQGMYRAPSGMQPGMYRTDSSAASSPSSCYSPLQHAVSGVPQGMYRSPSAMPVQWVAPGACYPGGPGVYPCHPMAPHNGLQHAYSSVNHGYGPPGASPLQHAGSGMPVMGGLYPSPSGMQGYAGQPPPPPPPAPASRLSHQQGHAGGGAGGSRLRRGKSGLNRMISGMPEGGLSDPEHQQHPQGSMDGGVPEDADAAPAAAGGPCHNGQPEGGHSSHSGRPSPYDLQPAPPPHQPQQQPRPRVRICLPPSAAPSASGESTAAAGGGSHPAGAASQAGNGGNQEELVGSQPSTLEEAWRSNAASAAAAAGQAGGLSGSGGSRHFGGEGGPGGHGGWVHQHSIHTSASGMPFMVPHLIHAASGMPMSPMGWHPGHLVPAQSGLPAAALVAAAATPWQVQQVQHLAQQGLWRQGSAAPASPRQHHRHHHHHTQQGVWRQGSAGPGSPYAHQQHQGAWRQDSNAAAASPRVHPQQQGMWRQKSTAAVHSQGVWRQGSSSPLGHGQHHQQHPHHHQQQHGHSQQGSGGSRSGGSPLGRTHSAAGQHGVHRQGSGSHGGHLWKQGSQSPGSPRSPRSRSPGKERRKGGVRFAEQAEVLCTQQRNGSPARSGSGELDPGAAGGGEVQGAADPHNPRPLARAPSRLAAVSSSWDGTSAGGATPEGGSAGQQHGEVDPGQPDVRVVPRPPGVHVPRRNHRGSSAGGSWRGSSSGGSRGNGGSQPGSPQHPAAAAEEQGGPRSRLGGRPGSGQVQGGHWAAGNNHTPADQHMGGRPQSAGQQGGNRGSNAGAANRLGQHSAAAAAMPAPATIGVASSRSGSPSGVQQGPLVPHHRLRESGGGLGRTSPNQPGRGPPGPGSRPPSSGGLHPSTSPAGKPGPLPRQGSAQLVPHKVAPQMAAAGAGSGVGLAAPGKRGSSAGASRCSSAASGAPAGASAASRCASPSGVVLPPLRTPSPAGVGGGGGILASAAAAGPGAAAGRLRPASAGAALGAGAANLAVQAKGIGLVRSPSNGNVAGQLQPSLGAPAGGAGGLKAAGVAASSFGGSVAKGARAGQ